MKVKVNILLYSPVIIEESIDEFVDIAKIKITKRDKKYYNLEITNIDEDYQENFLNEYLNYLLISDQQ